MSHRQMIEPMLFFWKLYVDGNDHGISNQVEQSCLRINKPTIKVNHRKSVWIRNPWTVSRYVILYVYMNYELLQIFSDSFRIFRKWTWDLKVLGKQTTGFLLDLKRMKSWISSRMKFCVGVFTQLCSILWVKNYDTN